jgi:hypothetical protein
MAECQCHSIFTINDHNLVLAELQQYFDMDFVRRDAGGHVCATSNIYRCADCQKHWVFGEQVTEDFSQVEQWVSQLLGEGYQAVAHFDMHGNVQYPVEEQENLPVR